MTTDAADQRVGRHAAGRESPLRHVVGQPECYAGRAIGGGEDVGHPVGSGLKAATDVDSAKSLAMFRAAAEGECQCPPGPADSRNIPRQRGPRRNCTDSTCGDVSSNAPTHGSSIGYS